LKSLDEQRKQGGYCGQTIKVAVMGKKAWLFFGSPEGGEAAAIFYTLTATCRRLKIDPLAYLSDVFKRLPLCDLDDPTSLDPLLPDRWLSEHPEARLPMREKEAQKKAERKRSHRAQIRRALARADAQADAAQGS
jgi:transposase